jgi:cation-transporting P-type ATPase E
VPTSGGRVLLVAGSGLAYVVIFSVPVAQKTFMIDPSNVVIMSIALAIGLAGAAIIEVLWWVEGALTGERRRLWRLARVESWHSSTR